MSKPSKRHPQAGDTRTSTFKMRPIAVACSSLMFIAGAAYAADPVAADDAAMETVVVTGMRHSIETSIAAKKNSDSIVEVVSAEDIGKLPDISIAESLARLPGLTAQRVDGRAQSISIRGMGPKYGVTLLNGREVVSTGDGRSVEYDQFPSELLNSATVYKTPDAALSAMGLSGTVNLKSVRPLDYKERKLSLNLRGEYNDNGALNAGTNEFGGRGSISYIDQFADNTIGVALGYAHLDNPGQEKYYKSYGWADLAKYPNQGWCGGGSCVRPGTAAGQQVLLGFEAGETSTSRRRDGFMAEIEYKPNDKFHSMVDLYYSKFDQTSIQREFQTGLDQWSGSSYTNPVISQVNGFNVVTGGTISGLQPIILNRYNTRKDKTIAIGWNADYKIDQWKFGADLSYSRARRTEYNGELTARAMTGAALTNVSLQSVIDATGSNASQFTPSINYADPALVLLADAYGRGGRATTPVVDDQMKAVRFDVERIFDNNPVTSVQGGVIYSDRTKDMNPGEVFYRRTGAPQVVASNLLNSPATAIEQSAIPGVLSWDYLGVLGAYYTPYDPNQPWNAASRNWKVEEKVTTAFGKASFDIDTVVPVSGNVGIQFVHTNLLSNGNFWNNKVNPNRLEKLSTTNSYNDILPSLNVKFDLSKTVTKDLYLRFGAAKEMARPPMDSMRASLDGGLSSTGVWSGSGGNPKLDPWRANAYDLSLEKYFGKRSYLSVAYFHKSVESSILNQTVRYDFTGFPITIKDANNNPIVPVSNIGNFTTQANGAPGYVRGKEVSFSLDGSLINSSLDGIGVIASLGATDSSLKEKGEGQIPTNLEGLSGITRNLTAYYERNGFNARISQRYRSAFAAQTRNQFGDLATSTIESEKLVDLQVGYEFEHGQYKGLSVLFQVNNLTDEPYRTSKSSDYDPSLILPERYNTHGRQFLFGVTYKM